MPRVGTKTFPYSPAGEAKAKAFSKKTQQPLKMKPPKAKKPPKPRVGY